MGLQKRLIEEKWWPGYDNYIAGIKRVHRGGNNIAFDKELERIFQKFEVFEKSFQGKDFEKVLGKAAIPARDIMKNEAPTAPEGEVRKREIPKSKKAHWVKDDGGTTRKVKPGNLKRSIQIFKGKKATRSVLVGPIVSKRAKVTHVEGVKKVTRRHRAFYWFFVTFGTATQAPNRFVERAREKSVPKVKSTLIAEGSKAIGRQIENIF
jgi:HK97 gp10 family phage protein